jgi:uncharacterized protein YjiS (DUF1127 family)
MVRLGPQHPPTLPRHGPAMQNILPLFAAASKPGRQRLGPCILLILALWHHRSRSRRHLALLDDRELADIGLSRTERGVECDKRFWQA